MEKQSNNCCWKGRINDEEVSGMENKEKDNETGSLKYEDEKTNKGKNKPNLNVDEQQDAIKHLKEYCDKDDIDPMKKAVCLTCNQQFVWKNSLEKNIQLKYTKLLWN